MDEKEFIPVLPPVFPSILHSLPEYKSENFLTPRSSFPLFFLNSKELGERNEKEN